MLERSLHMIEKQREKKEIKEENDDEMGKCIKLGAKEGATRVMT